MRTKKRIFRIVPIIISVSICLVSISTKPAANKNNGVQMLSFSDFKHADIGKATKAGTVTTNANELEINASGSDIWGRHDEFHFGYLKIQGAFDLSVQILSLSAAHLYTKAGIMARSDLSDSSMHVFYQVFPDNSPRNKNNGGCEFQYRSEKAAEMKAIYPELKTAGHMFDVAFPNTWIRLKRRGDIFSTYFSSDGKNWTSYSTFTLKMPQELWVGLAVTSHNPATFTTARFASIKLIKNNE
jgi:regulation of enolase protein 1 (concanavalin A-like superfamily)